MKKILGILISCKIMYYYIASYAWITVQTGMQLNTNNVMIVGYCVYITGQ
jgi:hypothetical protein